MTPPLRTLGRLACLVVLLSLAPAAGAEPEQDSPWTVLESARQVMAQMPIEAQFRQVFLPAGFSTGETEAGRLSLLLPRCLRWDYETPYARSYLICDGSLYSWNPGEASGRIHALGNGEEGGLDLLRRDIDDLRLRYRAEIVSHDLAATTLRLEPLHEDSEVASAHLTIEPGTGRFTSLSYSDREGNQSRFEISGYRPLMDESAFVAPTELEWIGQ